MALHFKGETQFPLGGDTYVTIKRRNKQPTIRISSYKNLKTITGRNVLIPTRFGVMLSPRQFDQLIKNTPLMVSTIESLQESKTSKCEDSSMSVFISSETAPEPVEKESLDEKDTSIETIVDDSKEVLHTSQPQLNSVDLSLQTENIPQLKKCRGRPPKKRCSGCNRIKAETCIEDDKENITPSKKHCNQSKPILKELSTNECVFVQQSCT